MADKENDLGSSSADVTAASAGPGVSAGQSAASLTNDQVRLLLDRLDALEQEKHARDQADQAAAGEIVPPPMTHVLVLSNGSTVETACPATTHHSDENGIYPVVACHLLAPLPA